ncbi:unnamed protein product [Calypogeia fissa]
MASIMPVSIGGAVPQAVEASSQAMAPRSENHKLHPRAHHHHCGPRGRRSSPSRLGRRIHLQKSSHGLARQHGNGDRAICGRKLHHEGPHHGPKGVGLRHGSRGLHEGLHDVATIHGDKPRRMHRSLSPHHLMNHDRSSDGVPQTPGSPHRGHGGHRRHRGHLGRVPLGDGGFEVIFFREPHNLHPHGQEPSSGSEPEPRSSPLQAAAMEGGIEQLGQLTLKSKSG